MRLPAFSILAAGALIVLTAACSGDDGPSVIVVYGPAPIADLRADSNRDGEVRFEDDSDANKLDWNDKVGAVFLANIDDDNGKCHWTESDDKIALCNDAQDDVINGEDDVQDFATLKTRPVPNATSDMTASVAIDTPEAALQVRLFYRTGPNPVDLKPVLPETSFTAAQVRSGIELAIEARDIVRDRKVWDGFANVRFTIHTRLGPSSDVVRMRVAPVLTYHHLLPAEEVWISNTARPGNTVTRSMLNVACGQAGLPKATEVRTDDPWTQDFFEPAFMSMPRREGQQHVIRVNYRSPNVYEPARRENPLRPAGNLVFRLRGKDIAAVQEFDIAHDPEMDTLNSLGNLETAPPYSANGVSYPFGRLVRGETPSYFPDRSFERMLEAQGQQPPIRIDTSWLLVGHVDETISFVKAPTPRGWKVLVNDPRLAKRMLEDQVAAGNGDLPMFAGKNWWNAETLETTPAEITIHAVLADPLVMEASAEAAAEVDAQLTVLKNELSLADDEIIRVPFLHSRQAGLAIAYQPATVNGVYLADDRFAAPDPHGPVVNGRDIFRDAIAKPLEELGITTDFVEDWDEYHVATGEIHCATNATRRVPDTKWWESGR